MESPKLTYEFLKKIDNIERVAYERLFENYLNLNLKGDDKKLDVESTDQETVLNRMLGGIPVPGMVYTFIHVNQNTLQEIQNFKSGKIISFHDLTPILFCTSFNSQTNLIKGLNLTLLPKLERLKFFQIFWEYYKDFFNRVEEKTEYNQPAINKSYQLASMMGKNPQLFEVFNRRQNAEFNYSYRSYNIHNIRKFRMIEYEEWKYVPFFDARHSFKRANLEEIYRTYWDNKRKT